MCGVRCGGKARTAKLRWMQLEIVGRKQATRSMRGVRKVPRSQREREGEERERERERERDEVVI